MIRVRSLWAIVFAIVLACSGGGGLSASSAAATTTHDATAICTYDPAPPSALLTCAPSRANGAGRSVRVAPTKAAIPSMAQRDGGSRRSTGTRIATNSADDAALSAADLAERVGSGKAPLQVTPGETVRTGEFVNDIGPGGTRIEPWEAHYDEYGRMIARTDYNAGNSATGVADVHYHVYEWGPGCTPCEVVKHAPGVYPG